ncbi:MAG TPA: hypothetical protein VIY73_18050 [Polyangiaceae bacterium]
MSSSPPTAAAGLCEDCRHSKRIISGRGSVFWLCTMHDRDPRFAKYPRLPVLRCAGYEREGTAG